MCASAREGKIKREKKGKKEKKNNCNVIAAIPSSAEVVEGTYGSRSWQACDDPLGCRLEIVDRVVS